MSNVFQLPTRGIATPPADDSIYMTPTQVLRHARQLHGIGILGNPAWAIACQALYFLSNAKKNYVEMTLHDMVHRHVVYEGQILCGSPKVSTAEDILTSLCELHEYGGILNSLDKQFFNQNNNPRQHFSLPHPMRQPIHLEADTPIYFRLSKEHPKVFADRVNEIVKHDLEADDELIIWHN